MNSKESPGLWVSIFTIGAFVLTTPLGAFFLVEHYGFRIVGSLLIPIVLPLLTAFTAYMFSRQVRELEKDTRERIAEIEVKAEREPERSKFAWDLARIKLEAYFDRNLMQVFMIFAVAILVMIVGFGFVLWGVRIAIANPTQSTSWVAAISGIITQFIGVTFMVIHRSTMAQANAFMEVLERINTVGMAVQILDSIPEGEAQLKNATRAELVTLLVSGKTATRKADKIVRAAPK